MLTLRLEIADFNSGSRLTRRETMSVNNVKLRARFRRMETCLDAWVAYANPAGGGAPAGFRTSVRDVGGRVAEAPILQFDGAHPATRINEPGAGLDPQSHLAASGVGR